MNAFRLAYVAGPLAVRDLVLGSASIAVSATAFLAGCAFASNGNLAWFTFLGVLGVVSLATGVPAFVFAERVLRRASGPDDNHAPVRAAA